jgi:hypothetical protein
MTMKYLPSRILALACAGVALFVVAWPFTRVHYPPIADLPFHAATMSILRHYFDPAFHFREQFEVSLFRAPYFSMHVLGAIFALVMPIAAATKMACVVLLLTLPAGLAVMFLGMKKSPLLGLLALPLVWNTLTQWGFINFVGAIGLFAAVVGCTLRVVDAPSPRRQWELGIALLLVFVTHIFRFPFAIAAVVGTALVMYPATRRVRPLIAPLLPALAALGMFLALRDKDLAPSGIWPITFHTERFAEASDFLFGALTDPEEARLAGVMYRALAAVVLACCVGFFLEQRWRGRTRRERFWSLGAAAVPLAIAAVFLSLYLVLPMQMGFWWYVYPREIFSCVFILLGVCPDLPRRTIFRAPLLAGVAVIACAQMMLVAKHWSSFDAKTKDFEEIMQRVPQAPKLGYVVWDKFDPDYKTPTFIHIPAWIQAERGGWLSFHFVSWNPWSVRYRDASPAVPPPTPLRFEWTPERFDLATRGKFFDWFLVRSLRGQDPRFARANDLALVDHVGAYWLYQRRPE